MPPPSQTPPTIARELQKASLSHALSQCRDEIVVSEVPTNPTRPAQEQKAPSVPQSPLVIEEREQRQQTLRKLFELDAKGMPASKEQLAADAGVAVQLQLARRSSKVSQLGVAARAAHDSRRRKRFAIIEEANQRFARDRTPKAPLYGRRSYERLLDDEKEEANQCCAILNASIAHLVQMLMGIVAGLQMYLLATMAQPVSFTATLLSAIASSIALADVSANLFGLVFDHLVPEKQDTASTLSCNALCIAKYEECVVILTSTVVRKLKQASVSSTWFSLFDICGVGEWLRLRVASGYGAVASKFTSSNSGVDEFICATVASLISTSVAIAAALSPQVVVAAATAAAVLGSSAAKSSAIAEKPKGCTAEALGSQLRQSPMKSLAIFIGTVLAMDSGIGMTGSITVIHGGAIAEMDHAELALRLPSTSFTPAFISPSVPPLPLPPLPLLPSPSLPPLPPPPFHRWWALHKSPSPPPTLPSPILPPLIPPPPHLPPLKPPPPPSFSPLKPPLPPSFLKAPPVLSKESDGKSRCSEFVALAVQLGLAMVCCLD